MLSYISGAVCITISHIERSFEILMKAMTYHFKSGVVKYMLALFADHEKYCRRSRDAAAVQAAGPAAAAADSDLKNSDAGILYKDQDLSLKAGETMTIKASSFLDRKVGSNGGGFMAGLPAISSGNTSGSGAVGIPRLSPIAPPPLAQTFTLPAIPGPSSATQVN